MGGLVQMVVITPTQEVIIKTLETGKESDFFFSQSFCDGDFEKTIEQFSQEENQLSSKEQGYNQFAPYNYGIVVIDFYHKKIHDMQSYSSVCYKKLVNYNLYKTNKHRMELLKNNKLSLFHYETGEKHNLCDVFKNKNINEIYKIIIDGFDNNKISLKQINQYFSIFKKSISHVDINDLMIGPTSLDFNIQHYKSEEIERLILNLVDDDIIFSEEDKKAWIYYIKKYEDKNMEQKINQLFNNIELNKKLNSEMSISLHEMKKAKL